MFRYVRVIAGSLWVPVCLATGIVVAAVSLACNSGTSTVAGGPQAATTPLYRVTNAQPPDVCIPGEVTTRQGHKGCITEFIGNAVPVRRDVAHRLRAGVTPGKNDGSVTIIEPHLGGQTEVIGFSVDPKDSSDSQPLHVGAEPNCNLGVVSTASDHKGCHTIFLGWTSRN